MGSFRQEVYLQDTAYPPQNQVLAGAVGDSQSIDIQNWQSDV